MSIEFIWKRKQQQEKVKKNYYSTVNNMLYFISFYPFLKSELYSLYFFKYIINT